MNIITIFKFKLKKIINIPKNAFVAITSFLAVSSTLATAGCDTVNKIETKQPTSEPTTGIETMNPSPTPSDTLESTEKQTIEPTPDQTQNARPDSGIEIVFDGNLPISNIKEYIFYEIKHNGVYKVVLCTLRRDNKDQLYALDPFKRKEIFYIDGSGKVDKLIPTEYLSGKLECLSSGGLDFYAQHGTIKKIGSMERLQKIKTFNDLIEYYEDFVPENERVIISVKDLLRECPEALNTWLDNTLDEQRNKVLMKREREESLV